MAIQTIKATMQMRHGREEDFDPSQMTVGEWAVCEDTKKVWMCFLPGFVLRMATYEAFEQDMEHIHQILSECQDIRTAVEEFGRLAEQHETQAEYYSILSESWAVGGTGERDGEDMNNSKYHSVQSKSYAHGGTGLRVGEDTDNSEYYSKVAKKLVEEATKILETVSSGGLIPAGTVRYEELPSAPMIGFMYNVSNDFITDDRFIDGAGKFYSAGSNVYWTVEGKWDVLAANAVFGVKGDKEEEYRQGFVNITPGDIGAATLEDLSGVNADFVGSKEELEEKIQSGEVKDGMTAYVTNDDSGGEGGGGNSSITIDSELSETSENPVQNKVITGEFNKYVQKTGGEIEGVLKVRSLVLGTTPSDEIGAIWIE